MGLACHRSRPPGARQAAFLRGVRTFARQARSCNLSVVHEGGRAAVTRLLLSLAGGVDNRRQHHSILMPASLMIFAYFATSTFINAVTSSGFEMKASDPCLTR